MPFAANTNSPTRTPWQPKSARTLHHKQNFTIAQTSHKTLRFQSLFNPSPQALPIAPATARARPGTQPPFLRGPAPPCDVKSHARSKDGPKGDLILMGDHAPSNKAPRVTTQITWTQSSARGGKTARESVQTHRHVRVQSFDRLTARSRGAPPRP